MKTNVFTGFAFLVVLATQLLSGQVLVAITGTAVATCPTTPVPINNLQLASVLNSSQTLPAGTVITYQFSAPVRGTPSIPSIPDATVRVVNAVGTGAVIVYAPKALELFPGRPLSLIGVEVDASSLSHGGVVTMAPSVGDPSAVDLPAAPVAVVRADTALCPNPVPTLASISPTSVIVGEDPPTLTVTGTNFVAGSTVQYRGTPLPTTVISSTQLKATLDFSMVGTPGLAEVTVFNPSTKAGPGGGTSAPATFAVQFATGNPFPVITSMFPTTVLAGGTEDLILVLTGTGFMKEASVKWNGATMVTDQVFPPTNHVTGYVPASLLQSPQLVQVWVENSLPNGGPSNRLVFKVDETKATLNRIFPTGVPAANQLFTMQLIGANFSPSSVVLVNGTPVQTTFLSKTEIYGNIPTSLVNTGGLATIVVQGAFTLSNAQILTITNPAPGLSAMSPTSVAAGVPPFTLSITGSQFVRGSVVQWNGQARPTTYVDALHLTATIPATDLTTPGTVSITVTNPAPGGGTTAALSFTITAAGNNPVPAVSSLSPALVAAGKGPLTLVVNGNNFAGASVVRWNGQNRPTTVLSSSQLRATLTAQDTAATGSGQVTVFSPAPGGGLSSALTLTLTGPVTVEDLVASCPSSQEVSELNAKLPLIFDADPTAGTLVCRAADGSADLTRLKERAYQALRAMKQTVFDSALPWTSKNLLDWAGGVLKGVRFRADITQATCCDAAGVASIPTGNLAALQTSRWLDPQLADGGLANLVVEIAGQARKNEGYPLGCGAKDNALADGGSWAVQYYLWEWLAFRASGFLTSTLPGVASTYYSDISWRKAQAVRDTQFCSTGGGIVVNGTTRSFGSQSVNTTSAGQSIVVSATTPTPVSVNSVTFGGANASDFLITNNSCQDTAVPRSCLITVLFQPQALGSRSALLTLTHSASSSAISIGLSGNGIPPAPQINPGGILNGASFGSALSGGVLSSLFGASLGSGTSGASGLPLPTTLGQTSVQMNGSNVPLIFVSPQQINFQVPWELLNQTTATLTVTTGGAVSSPQQVTLGPAAPAIFTIAQDGRGQGAILIANAGDVLAAPAGSIAGRVSRPARRGESVTIFCVGLGEVSNRPASGTASPSAPLSLTQASPTVTIGGVSATVSFSGLAPGFVGLYQVNVQIPDGVPDGDSVSVVITVGGASSNSVTLAVAAQ